MPNRERGESNPGSKSRLARLSASIVHFLNIERALQHGPPQGASDLPSTILPDFRLYLGTAEHAANPWILNQLGITHVVNAAGLAHGAWEGSMVGKVGSGLDKVPSQNGMPPELDSALGLRIAKKIVEDDKKNLEAIEEEGHGHGRHAMSTDENFHQQNGGPSSPVLPSPTRARKNSLYQLLIVPNTDMCLPDRRIEYLNVQIRDTANTEIASHFREVANFIDGAKAELGDKTRVLIHCQAGVSRSVSLCIGYLMIGQGMTLDEAWRTMRKARPQAHPNIGFAKQLLDFYMDHLGGTDEGCEEFRDFVKRNTPIMLGWHA